MSCSCPEPCAHTGKKNFYVYLYLQLVYHFNWNRSAGLTSRGQHELKLFNMELHVTQEHVSKEMIWASLCHLMVVFQPDVYWGSTGVLNCVFFSRYVYAVAHSGIIELWSMCSVSPMPSSPRGLCPHTSLDPQPHICCLWSTGSTRFPHACTLRLRASLNVQVVMTTMSAALNATLGSEAALALLHISTALMQW